MRVFRVKPGHARPIRAWEAYRSPYIDAITYHSPFA